MVNQKQNVMGFYMSLYVVHDLLFIRGVILQIKSNQITIYLLYNNTSLYNIIHLNNKKHKP